MRRSILGGLACAACGGPPHAEVASAVSQPLEASGSGPEAHDAPRQLSNVWTLTGDVEITDATVAPEPVGPDRRLRVGFTAHGAQGCEVRVVASPPRVAARQVVWRGTGSAAAADEPRVVEAVAPIDAASAEVSVKLELPRPWHPATVVVEMELWCRGRRQAVVSGPRRELRTSGRRHPGARAVVGVFAVQRVPTPVEVPLGSPTVDGRLAAQEWEGHGTPLVQSVDGEPVTDRSSRVWFAWDERALYVAGRFDDPDVWSEMTRHDDPLWQQEVFEVFVAGADTPPGRRSGPYVELQVSPAGIAFDAAFDDQREGSPAWNGAWNRAVAVHGTLNDDTDRDEGWTAELAIPWTQLCAKTELVCPPRAGLSLRLNAFRFERVDRKRAEASALSPTLATDFHAWDNAARLELLASATARRERDEQR